MGGGSAGLPELLLGAFALMLVAEGLLPFISPARWRAVFEKATRLTDAQIRAIGLVSMLSGLVMLSLFVS